MGLDSERILFELSYPRVYRAVYVYCRSHQLAEDAVQEAFLIAFQKAAKLREKSKFLSLPPGSFCNNSQKSEESEMKATGIVRQVDGLGRIVIPRELRRLLSIEVKDPLEIFTAEDQIILKKFEPACIFCDQAENLLHGA